MFSENLLAMEMEKIKVKMNKPVYLGWSILGISKTLMYEFWYDYIKSKCPHNAKLYYMHTDSFIIFIKTDDLYKETENDVEKNISYMLQVVDHCLQKKNKKVIRFMKDELGGN